MADPLTPSDLPSPLARTTYAADELDDYRRTVEPAAPRDRVGLHVLLFVLTFLSTTWVGASMYVSYMSDFGYRNPRLTVAAQLIGGLWYSVPALLILGCHEMGHYLACRYYRINTSLPYFIPAPIMLFGTLGAVIRIREPLRNKRQLFDQGIAGPIAGFVVLLPALVLGLAWSRIIRQPPRFVGIELGEPLIFQAVSRFFFGTIPDGYMLNAHPMAFAALFGLLATMFNLLPIGQLDGGHIAYSALGRRARWFTIAGVVTLVFLGVTFAFQWLVWAGLMIALLWLTGWEHPRTPDEDEPLDGTRWIMTGVALLIFVVSFVLVPAKVTDFLNR